MNRDELVERVALLVASYMGCEDCGTGPGECPCRDLARAALAIIEPVVREECARVAADYHNNSIHGAWASLQTEIAAAIRAGAKP